MWNIIQCEVQGKFHFKNGIPCQDKVCSKIGNNTQVIALADGAGSASLSHYGAQVVVEYICETMSSRFTQIYEEPNEELAKQQILEGVILNLKERSSELNCEINNLASTLLFVAVHENQFILGHIGDGVIGCIKDNELKVASLPTNGEFLNTTIFTTSQDSLSSMKITRGLLNGITGFVIMSDGTETGLYNRKSKTFSDALQKIMNLGAINPSTRIQEQLRQSMEDVLCQVTSDDCSIAILSRLQVGFLNLPDSYKAQLLEFDSCSDQSSTKRRIKQYDSIIAYLQEKRSLKDLAHHIHLRPEHTKKRLDRLCDLGLVKKTGEYYQATV